MRLSKRTQILIITTLVVLLASVFLFTDKASAQSLIDNQVASPLRDKEPILERQTQLVSIKTSEIEQTALEIREIESKRQSLSEEIENTRLELEEIQQKIVDKKARIEAERKRVEELKKRFVSVTRYASNSSGNTYVALNCTWYAKSRRPDLPNGLGHAKMWYANAAAQGWNVGTTPKKGAIATSTNGYYGHVAYVEGVSLDGLWVTVSEMNYAGLGVVSSRTVKSTEFKYIYELN